MFVPFDNLYNFLEQFATNDTLIYQFRVPGNRNVSNVQLVSYQQQSWLHCATSVYMLMHDQEPLNFDYYLHYDQNDITEFIHHQNEHIPFKEISVPALHEFYDRYQTELNVFPLRTHTIFDRWILCHSELNSSNLIQYENIGAVGVYWWSHALISKDWFRFAQIDSRLAYNRLFEKDFNIYNRAWAGTREYRLKFTELILKNKLDTTASITFSPLDNSTHYTNHQFKNSRFVVNHNLEVLPGNHTPASASADYNYEDYQRCAIDVVLETLFDDSRLHLTEKTIRPIACGKPFVLAATPGSLKYLKDYGFKTFGNLIDESYDNIADPIDRLNAIIKVLTDISSKTTNEKNLLYKQMHEIASYNKKVFWSSEFSQRILNEFVTNYNKAYSVCKQHPTGKNWLKYRGHLATVNQSHKEFFTVGTDHKTQTDMRTVYEIIANVKTSL